MASGIEWTTETWNPVVGCSRVSEGCIHCYAEQMAGRLKQMGVDQYQDVVHQPEGVDESRWTGDIEYAEHRLSLPLEWEEPRRVFVDSMSDLFHPEVDFEYIAAVFGVMAAADQHTFQILTKRPGRMREFFRWVKSQAKNETSEPYCQGATKLTLLADCALWREGMAQSVTPGDEWPLPNVWLGVSAEDQDAADERIPPLLNCPAAVRFVSAEPLLGPIDFTSIEYQGDRTYEIDPLRREYQDGNSFEFGLCNLGSIDWVIVGGESGRGARECRLSYVRRIISNCRESGTPVFVKQLGAKPRGGLHDETTLALDDSKGGAPDEWPEDLRVRELPEGVDHA